MEPDASVQLAARLALGERLAATVKAANSGAIAPEISACYFGVKREMIKLASAIRDSRCQAISAAFQAKDVTFDAIWTRSRIKDAFEEFHKEHQEAWKEAEKQNKVKDLLEQFTEEAKSKACSPASASDPSAQRLAAKTAAQTCM